LPVIHPGVSFFGNKTSTSARAMIDAGLAVALASDYNPVVTPSFDMKLMMSLGCIRHGMTAEEAINAATINAAYAMDISKGYGSVAKGKAANILSLNQFRLTNISLMPSTGS
jgi:Imidazolonepropionase and related amidohydrolases